MLSALRALRPTAETPLAELDAKQIYRNAMPLIAVVLMASGILVKTVPLESRRPVDPQRVAFAPAGRQDVEARLWDDPFAVMRALKSQTPAQRCSDAKNDLAHQAAALHGSIAYRTKRGLAVSVLAVMVPGGPYFEDAEARRRSRYAVVSALLEKGWTPASEDKLGYVWTLESCNVAPWRRLAPELLPYEWFRFNGNGKGAEGEGAVGAPRRELLVLWVDESAVSSRPLQGVERIVERLAKRAIPCKKNVPPSEAVCYETDTLPIEADQKRCGWREEVDRRVIFGKQVSAPPWCDTRVIGPSTSGTLQGLIRDLAKRSKPTTTAGWLRFYASGATALMDDETFRSALDKARTDSNSQTPSGTPSLKELKEQFARRVVRLTATDDQLTRAFAQELRLRLVDPTPFWRLGNFEWNPNPLCGGTVVLVSEGDTSYARRFRDLFVNESFGACRTGQTKPKVMAVNYLRGLDGVLPVGAGTPEPAVAGQRARAPGVGDTLLDPVALERADGRSQYDYLRRLAQQLGEYDRNERRAGHIGIRGVGVLGNDTYDKLLVLDALREQFPDAVYFAADLDARLISGGAVRSTRNLVVASAYGLTLDPGLQGAVLPFRDTYQTGTYFTTRFALDERTAWLSAAKLPKWFANPQLFEIGRTRAVPLSKGASEPCDAANLLRCENIHALDEWKDVTLYPAASILLAVAAMAVSGAALVLLFSQRARRLVLDIRERSFRGYIVRAMLLLVTLLSVSALLVWAIWRDASAGGGEPFAWVEGVSIWPTQILRLAIFFLTIGFIAFGRWQLHQRIDKVAGEFRLTSLTERDASPLPPAAGKIPRAGGMNADNGATAHAGTSSEPVQPDPWTEYLDRMRFRASGARIALTAALFFAFSVALASIDWPHSPHRGALSAWINHLALLLLLGAMTALLFAALDASRIVTHLLRRLHPGDPMQFLLQPEEGLTRQYPVGERAHELWGRFRLAVRVASEVNGFIYLPFLTILLIIPTQSRIFDDWNLSLPFAALLAISFVLAALCARQLRRGASRLKGEILRELEADARRCEENWVAEGPVSSNQESHASGTGSPEGPAELKAKSLRQIAEEIRAVRDGPFLPLAQEPAVRAILLVLGGAGGISTAEFLFLSRG